MDMIQTDKLVFEYDKRDEDGNIIGKSRAIDEVDIDVKEGQFIAILGHNGSGKSTFAKHINALLVPTDGTMWVDGRDTKDPNELWNVRQSAGMVSESRQSDYRNGRGGRCWIWPGESGRTNRRNLETCRRQFEICWNDFLPASFTK